MRNIHRLLTSLIFATALLSGAAPSFAQRAVVAGGFGAVRIDTRLLATRVGPDFAARVAHLLRPVAENVFARDISGHGGRVLVLKLDDVTLGPTDTALGAQDYIRGAGLVVEGRRVIARYRVGGELQGDQTVWQAPDLSEDRRISALLDFYARWLQRKMGLS